MWVKKIIIHTILIIKPKTKLLFCEEIDTCSMKLQKLDVYFVL